MHSRLAMFPSLDEEFLDGERTSNGWPCAAAADRKLMVTGYGSRAAAYHRTGLLETEDAAPHAVEADRNDRRLDAFMMRRKAAPERQQRGRCA